MIRPMKVPVLLWLLLSCVIAFGWNCNKKANKAIVVSTADERRIMSAWETLQQTPLLPDHLEAKSKLDIDVPDLSIGVRLHWYWVRDSALWIRVTKIIETHRILITPDSFKLLDNLNNEYVYGSTRDWLRKQKLPVDFNGFQRLLLGQCPDLSSPERPLLTIKRDSISIQGLKPMSPDPLQYLVQLSWPNQDIPHMEFSVASGEAISIHQDRFTNPGLGPDIPWLRHYHVDTPEEKYTFDLEINDWKINRPKPVYFQVPASYERVPL